MKPFEIVLQAIDKAMQKGCYNLEEIQVILEALKQLNVTEEDSE
jgi:hypothetical protein